MSRMARYLRAPWSPGGETTPTGDRVKVSPPGRRAVERPVIGMGINARIDNRGGSGVRLAMSTEHSRGVGGGFSIERPFGTLCVSIVCAIDGARFAAVAATKEECLTQVAAYVADQAGRQLHPSSALRVQDLLAAGDAAAAVLEYFRHSGEQWDREWLVTTSLHANSRSSVWSGAIPLPKPAQR